MKSDAAYYNEIDPYAAQWLRNLIAAGHIAHGVVDERSIEDVHPDDLREFTQCHFFAGIGVWSLALRRAGWPDDRPVWTGSCPCQPFSAAGAGAGFEDPRHLWPSFAWLIRQCRPPVVFGEQVASKAVEPWVDLVHADMEALGYAFGAVPFPSAGVGAPHIRDRLYWVANADCSVGGQGSPNFRGRSIGSNAKPWARSSSSMPVGMADAGQVLGGRRPNAERPTCKTSTERGKDPIFDKHGGSAGRLANADIDGLRARRLPVRPGRQDETQAIEQRNGEDVQPGPLNGLWRSADWLFCRDGKWRPVEPGTFPLAARPATDLGRVQPGVGRLYGRNRTGRLRGYGNAINAEAATQFIIAHMETNA